MHRKSFILAACTALGLAAPASAHNAWFLPSRTVLSDTNQSVTVDAGASTEPFQADHAAMNIDDVKVCEPDGSMGEIENAARGRYRSTFDVRIDKEGTWRIGMENTSIGGTFKVKGEEWRIGRRRGGGGPGGTPSGASAPPRPDGEAPMAGGPQGPGRPGFDPARMVDSVEDIPADATDLDLTERVSRNEFFVTAGAPTDTVLNPTNRGLEFVPETLPTDLVSNEPGRFRFLIDGKPAAGMNVEVIPGGKRFSAEDHAQELSTDSDGRITVNWPVAGYYWLSASHSDDKPSNPKANARRLSYVATLEVLAP